MEIAPYSLPQPEVEPIFGGEPPKKQQLQQPQIPQMEINVDRVMEDIQNFNGTPEEAEVLSNLYIGNKIGSVPKPDDYKSNVDSYLYQGAADADPVELLNYIKRGFVPEEDQAYTSLKDFEALSPEEQWDKIKAPFEVGRGVAIGATMPAVIPQQYQQSVSVSEDQKQKHINNHINELRSSSQTWKLEQGKGLSDRAKKMVNKMAITKEPPNLFEYNSLSDKDKSIIPIYASGRNPKHDVSFYEALTGTIKNTAGDIAQSFIRTSESIDRARYGVEDPEEFFLRFNAKYGDAVDTGSLTDDQRRSIKNWVIDQIQPTIDDPLSIGEAYTQETYDKADEIMSMLDEYMTVGEEARMQKKLESMTRNVTREVYKTGLVGEAVLSATQMGMDLSAVAALSVGTMGLGGMAYSAGRFYGDYEETLLDAGVDPQKARSTAVLTTIPYILVEQLQASQVFGKQFKGVANKIVDDLEIGKIATNAIKNSSNPKISKLATGAKVTADYIDNVSAELFEEIGQEVFSEIGKHSAIEGYELEESFRNVIETGKEAFKGLLILGAGGPVMRGIKGGYDGDFIEQDISDTIEGAFDPLTQEETDLAALDRLQEEEFQAAEDKESYLEEQDFNPREREIIGVTQDIKQEEIQKKIQEVDDLEAKEGILTLKDRLGSLEAHADITEDQGGIKVTTDKGVEFRVEFDEGLKVAGEYDPSISTIKLNPNTGQPTIDHEKVHLFKNIGLITDDEFSLLENKAVEYFGKDEIKRIKEENIKGYEKEGRVATKEILSEEIVANYFEDLSLKKEIPEDVRNIFQKILDYIKESLRQYIGKSVSGDKMTQLIQSGEILKRAPSTNGVKKMERAAKRREEAKTQKQRAFIEEALTESEANNKELVSAIEALSKLEQIPRLSPQESIEQATGVSQAKGMRAEDFVTGDEIIEGQLPGDFFQSEEEGAGLTGEDLYSYGETIQNPILEFIEENGGIARTPEIEQEIKNRFGDMVATKRYVNKSGALEWDQMAELLSTEPSSPLFEREVTKDDILDYIGQDSDTKFSFSPRSERDAVTVLANAIVTGKAKSLAQREQILNSYKVPLENQAAIKERAFKVVEQVEQELGSMRNTETIRNAIRKAEIKQFYDAQRKEIYEKGIEQGELLSMARERLKADRKSLKEAAKLNRASLPQMQEKVRSINDELAMLKFVDDIVEDSKKAVFPKKAPKNWQRDPRVLGTIRESVRAAANHILKNVAPGANKQKLQQQLKEIFDKSTYNGLRNASERVLNNILAQAEKTTKKQIQSKLKSTLKKYSSKPKAKKDARKRTIEGKRHWFLYYGNKAMNMSVEEFQNKMESIEADLIRYAEGKRVGDDINYENSEIEYRSYMTFGGLNKEEANLPDIITALEYAEKVIADGKALVMKLLEAHNEKYAETSAALIDAVISAKPHVDKIDKKGKLGQLFDTFGTMNVRGQLEFITQYGTDSDKKKLEKILFGNDTSKVNKKQRILLMNRLLQEAGSKLGIKNVEKFAMARSKPEKKYRKYSHEGRTDMSRANLMQLYMTFRQPDVLKMATDVNNDGDLINPDLYKRLQQMSEIRKELTSQEMQLADAMGDLLSTLLPDINKAYKSQYGINMKIQEENYWPLRVQAKSGGYASQIATVSEAPGFTIQRVSHRNDLDERADIFEVFSGHVSDAAHYIETIDSQLAIRSTLTNHKFREAVRQTYGKETLQQVDGSIVDMAIDRALDPDAKSIPIIDVARSLMSTISIGYNPKSVLVAGFGAVNIMTTHKGTIRAIKSVAKNPSQYSEDVKFIWNSVVVQNRLDQGLNEQMRNALERSKGNAFIRKYQEIGFAPLSYTDASVVALTGAAIYNDFKNSEAAAGLTQEEIQSQGLALVDRAVQEAYQPTDPDYLPATIRRGGSLTKALFQFKTEPMSKLGIYRKDWQLAKSMWDKGQKNDAVKKAIKIVAGQHIVIPTAYWLAGEVMRFATGEEDEWEEMQKRLMVNILVGPMAGLLYVGTGLELLVKGIVGDKIFLGSSTPSDRIVNEVKFLYDRGAKWDDEEIDEKILKIIKQYNSAAKNTLKIIED